MTKKIIYSSILAMMLLGCGSGDSSSTDNKTSNNQEQQQEETENRVEDNQTNQVNEISLKSENRNVSTKIDIKYLSENNVKKLIDILNQNGYNTFSQKHVDTIYSDFDEDGEEFYIITFDEDGYIILNPNLNSNALYGLDETNIYNSISQTEKTTINIDWMSIIADEVEIPFEKLKKTYQKTGDRKLITKITWTSGSTRTDFDLYVKSPDGQICNWQWDNRNKEDWGTTFLRDDQGGAYRKSYEAFSVDLDKMDEYATKNNLFGRDEGKYKFYVARYTGANINYKFSYGLTGECSASNSNDCPYGNWIRKADIKHKDYYSVYYKPKKLIYLSIKPYSTINKDDMLIRYKNSRNYYNLHKEELDKQANIFTNTIHYTGTIFDDNALGNVSSIFYTLTWFKASEALDRFLDASGNNINIDIEDTIEEGGIKKVVYSKIHNSMLEGVWNGTIEVKQWEWGTDDWSIGIDEKHAFGTLRIQWERDKDKNVVLFVNDIYSFDISDYSSGRPTIPLYKNAGDLVLSGRASDFYFTGRTTKISKEVIFNRAIEGGAIKEGDIKEGVSY